VGCELDYLTTTLRLAPQCRLRTTPWFVKSDSRDLNDQYYGRLSTVLQDEYLTCDPPIPSQCCIETTLWSVVFDSWDLNV
jgi:hypothetical protein